ncbi:DUF4238 domain-containing protein [Pseudomonas alliivorans]|uniref:DUF4238 domain-containing protein n=1 Tax=Pseudomonas alliivorans TaxID=2810613 RepID=A0ABS4CDV6_9PSED|nr:DUF4238 domain-containing protein [Pseudomonas alliivorans]MBP0948421.1 DUF4238 domain-containing protein [Pseudomonas alliivorans]MEE4328800.1 DUF4238 domain-containing protein [Pseudomonas alliivorans]MEE4370401.1 DUF4238 domain-containing protein [Pseudomonas alliivorans]
MKKKANDPVKHHYVPVYYQKAFLPSKDADLPHYKKEFEELKSKSPTAIMYETNLHTVRMRGKSTVMLEHFYRDIEGCFALYSELIRKHITTPGFFQELKKDENFLSFIHLIISFQFWRTPCNLELARQNIPYLLQKYDSSTPRVQELMQYDRRGVKFIQRTASKSDSLKIAQFLMLPLLTFDFTSKLENLRFFKTKPGLSVLSSDRPVLFSSHQKLFSFEEFAFPLAKDLFVVATARKAKTVDVGKLNRMIFDRARNFVISDDANLLDRLSKSAQRGRFIDCVVSDCVSKFEESVPAETDLVSNISHVDPAV